MRGAGCDRRGATDQGHVAAQPGMGIRFALGIVARGVERTFQRQRRIEQCGQCGAKRRIDSPGRKLGAGRIAHPCLSHCVALSELLPSRRFKGGDGKNHRRSGLPESGCGFGCRHGGHTMQRNGRMRARWRSTWSRIMHLCGRAPCSSKRRSSRPRCPGTCWMRFPRTWAFSNHPPCCAKKMEICGDGKAAFPIAGCCHGSCTHVWNYAQAFPHLYPQLERTLRDLELARSMDERGHVTFRGAIPDGPVDHSFHAAADGQLGGIMKVFRDWQIGGDPEWLRAHVPAGEAQHRLRHPHVGSGS